MMNDLLAEAMHHATRGRRDDSMKSLAPLCDKADQLEDSAAIELADTLHRIGIYAEAIRVYEIVANRSAISVPVASRLFDAANKCADHPRAYHWGLRSLCVEPDNVNTLNNLGIAALNMSDRMQARTWLMRALALKPSDPSILNNCALTDRALGNYEGAVERMMRAKDDVSSDNMIKNMSNLLYYVPDVPPSVIDGIHREWYRRWGANRRTLIRRMPYLLDPDKKLKIALVSSDWRNHPVGRNFLPIYNAVDRSKMEFVVMHQHGLKDEITKQYEAGALKFIPTLGYAPQSTAQLIANENCDIAIHFAGRFDDNRIMIAAHKPAPVQVSYLDAGRFHVPELDYLIVGRRYAPRDLAEMGTERILGIPRFYQHEPISPKPLTPPPFVERGFFTFGSYNSPVKINDAVLNTWARILDACPKSFLYFRYRHEFSARDIAKRILDALPDYRERIILDMGQKDHLTQMQHIDLHLDTFPFPGSTTTFELAWMGVPTLTTTGNTIMSHYGSGINHQLRLPDILTTHSIDDYVKNAIAIYQDPEFLIDIRENLRQRCMEKICKPINNHFERWMRAIWRHHCKTGGEQGAVR